MKKKQIAVSNTKIAIIFFVLLAVFVVVSLIFKLVLLVGQGQFDSSKRFTLSITNGKDIKIVSLSPATKSISVLKLKNRIRFSDAGRFLKIPIDGFATSNSLDVNQEINSLFLKTILGYKNLSTNLTVIDFVRIYLSARAISSNAVSEKIIDRPEGTELDKIVTRLVSDDLIEKEKQTIQIINGTNVAGLGNRLARLITNMGGDVIIVATSDTPRKKSTISFSDKKTYTVDKLKKILGYEIIQSTESAVSDITIFIGEDRVNSSPF